MQSAIPEAIRVVIYERGERRLTCGTRTITVPPEVLVQAEDGNPFTAVRQFARKLRWLEGRNALLWIIA